MSTSILILFALPSAQADVVLSEVMANTTSGQNTTDEYIELCNTSADAADVAGWSVSDGDDVDDLIAWSTHPNAPSSPGTDLVVDSTSIPGGDCALILDPDYPTGTQPYAIPSGTVILTVSNSAIGQGIGPDDAVTLYNTGGTASADVVDTYGTPVDSDNPTDRDDDGLDAIPLDPREGHSAFRIHLSSADEEGSWMEGAPTPGFRSSAGIFEVDPDGSGDYETIAEALLYALSGSQIVVRAGTYTEDLSIVEAVTIQGADPANRPNVSGAITLNDVGGTTTLQHLALGGGIQVDRAELQLLDNTISTGGVDYHYASGAVLGNSFSGAGLTLDYYTSPEVAENSFADTTNGAIQCTMGSEPWIHHNELQGTFGNGIDCTSIPIVEHNEVSGFLVGIRVTGNASVLHNRVDGSSEAGIQVGSSSLATVHGNMVLNCSQGIVTDHSAPTISSNVVASSIGTGVVIEGAARADNFIDFENHPTLVHNTVADNGADGISVSGTSISGDTVAPSLLANLVMGNTGFGISVDGTPTTASNVTWMNGGGATDGYTPDASDQDMDPMLGEMEGGNWTLASNSPLVDAGIDMAFASDADAMNSTRVTDGDGDGNALADIGAVELCPDLDGDGWSQDCGTGATADCDDDDADVSPDAEENWYDGIDQDCDGNDDDQDEDGTSVSADCDDTDPEVVTECPEDTGSIDDTGMEGEDKDAGSCGCTSLDATPGSAAWVLLVLGTVLRRRR